MSTVTKDCILGKTWEVQLAMLVVRKKCSVRSVKKWLLKHQPQEVAISLPLTVAGNDASTCNNLCTLGKDCSTVVGNGSWDNTHTSDLSSTGGRLSKEPSVLVQHAQHTNGSSYG